MHGKSVAPPVSGVDHRRWDARLDSVATNFGPARPSNGRRRVRSQKGRNCILRPGQHGPSDARARMSLPGGYGQQEAFGGSTRDTVLAPSRGTVSAIAPIAHKVVVEFSVGLGTNETTYRYVKGMITSGSHQDEVAGHDSPRT